MPYEEIIFQTLNRINYFVSSCIRAGSKNFYILIRRLSDSWSRTCEDIAKSFMIVLAHRPKGKWMSDVIIIIPESIYSYWCDSTWKNIIYAIVFLPHFSNGPFQLQHLHFIQDIWASIFHIANIPTFPKNSPHYLAQYPYNPSKKSSGWQILKNNIFPIPNSNHPSHSKHIGMWIISHSFQILHYSK